MAQSNRSKSFFELLFDFSFSEFIALKIVGVLYGIGLVLAGIAGIAVLFGSFAQGGISILIGLIGAPLVFLLYVLLIRVALESMIAAFRTASNTARIAENTRRDL